MTEVNFFIGFYCCFTGLCFLLAGGAKYVEVWSFFFFLFFYMFMYLIMLTHNTKREQETDCQLMSIYCALVHGKKTVIGSSRCYSHPASLHCTCFCGFPIVFGASSQAEKLSNCFN